MDIAQASSDAVVPERGQEVGRETDGESGQDSGNESGNETSAAGAQGAVTPPG